MPRIIFERGRKALVMDDVDHLHMLMNPRKISDEEDAGGVDVRLLDEDFDMGAIMHEDDAGSGSERSHRSLKPRDRGGSSDVDVFPDGDGGSTGDERGEEDATESEDEEEEEDDGGDGDGDGAPAASRDLPPRGAPPPAKPSVVMSKEEVNNAKRELLYRFDRMEKKGVRLPRRYSMASDYGEMQADYERLVKDRDADAGIRLQKQILVTVVSGVEYMNRRFDPFDFHLDGWGETISENISDYDDVLEELHAKYRGKSKMAPELKLLMMILGSAVMYHLTNTMFKSAPALGQVVKDNPDLMKQFAAATANTMQKQGTDKTGLAGLFSGLFGGGASGPASTYPPPDAQPPPGPPPGPMRGPSSSRVAEVQRFMHQTGGGVPNPSVRPPLPQVGRDFKPVREQGPPVPRRGATPGPTHDPRGEAPGADDVDADLMDIMSAASSEVTTGGTRRRRRVTLEL
eukprot:jgi/Tetstr1/454036/TSEL_040955.t1